MSALFASISSLGTDPTSNASRQAVLSAGQNLATAFNTASNTLTTQQTGLNSQVTNDVGQINQLAQQIAALNPQIVQQNAVSDVQNGGALQDQQDQLILKLSALTNVNVTQTNNGITVTTGNGTALVVAGQSFSLSTTAGANGMVQVLDPNGANITSQLTGGDLGGSIQTRDQTITGLLNQLDTLANQFATAFNSAQASGTDLNGNTGQNFFTVPATTSGSAANIQMAITNPDLLAASSDGTPGSDGNLASFSAIQTNTLPSGQTPSGTFSSLVYQIGSITASANAESSATTASLTQLNDQQNSVSGVSIDEESANLITYQQAYEAAARVVSTVQALMTVTMSMVTS
jgi:flagellar hook-associated protein 1 FlgK